MKFKELGAVRYAGCAGFEMIEKKTQMNANVYLQVRLQSHAFCLRHNRFGAKLKHMFD
jgi:hypothetical protein